MGQVVLRVKNKSMKLLLTIDDRQQVLYTENGARVPKIIKTVATQNSAITFHAGGGCHVQASVFAMDEKSKDTLFLDVKGLELFMPNGEKLPVAVHRYVFDDQSGYTVVEFTCQARMQKNILPGPPPPPVAFQQPSGEIRENVNPQK